MRDLGSGSAVLADANRKPCGEDVFAPQLDALDIDHWETFR